MSRFSVSHFYLFDIIIFWKISFIFALLVAAVSLSRSAAIYLTVLTGLEIGS
jgi:hypothetical protein